MVAAVGEAVLIRLAPRTVTVWLAVLVYSRPLALPGSVGPVRVPAMESPVRVAVLVKVCLPVAAGVTVAV